MASNGIGYEVTIRDDLPTQACVVCTSVMEGRGVDVGAVDVLCMTCGEAVYAAFKAEAKVQFDAEPKVGVGRK